MTANISRRTDGTADDLHRSDSPNCQSLEPAPARPPRRPPPPMRIPAIRGTPAPPDGRPVRSTSPHASASSCAARDDGDSGRECRHRHRHCPDTDKPRHPQPFRQTGAVTGTRMSGLSEPHRTPAAAAGHPPPLSTGSRQSYGALSGATISVVSTRRDRPLTGSTDGAAPQAGQAPSVASRTDANSSASNGGSPTFSL